MELKGLLPLALILTVAYVFLFGIFSSWISPLIGFMGSLTSAVVFFVFAYICLWAYKRWIGKVE